MPDQNAHNHPGVAHKGGYAKIGELGGPCAYCGCISGEWDYIPPRRRAPLSDARRMKVPVCLDCGNALQHVAADTFDARAIELAHRLRHRYRSALSACRLSEDELAELGDNLRNRVQATIELGTAIEQRLIVIQNAARAP